MARSATTAALVGSVAAVLALSAVSTAYLTEPAVKRAPPTLGSSSTSARPLGSTPCSTLGPEVPPRTLARSLAAFMAAAALGLVTGYTIPGWKLARAVPRPLPDFALEYPASMQGVDAANAAIKPGQFDFVMRSRVEASHFAKLKEELVQQQEKVRALPTKAEKVQRAQEQLRELATTGESFA